MKLFFKTVFIVVFFLGTTHCGPNQTDGPSILNNEFAGVGPAMAISAIADETYYGRVLFKSNGGQLYGAAIRFDLNTNSSSTAFFSNFYLDRLVLFVNMTTAIPIVTSPVNLNVNPSYSYLTNGLSISNVTSRYVGFNIDFGNNANFTSDVMSAAAIFTRDFSTFVGGDNSSFFFIAQKASSLPVVTSGDLFGEWIMLDFGVTGHGTLDIGSPSRLAAGGIGGTGYTIFKGSNISNSLIYGGEFYLTDSGTGAVGLGYDSTPPFDSTITMDGTVDGAFLLSPSKKFILGFDARNNRYFAGSR